MSDDGLRQAIEKMRARGARRRRGRRPSRHYYERLRGGRRAACCPRPSSSRSRSCPTSTTCPTTDRRRGARPGGRAQAQRRPRHEHGHDAGQVAARGQGRPDVPRRHRRARSSRLRERDRRAAAARAHELVRHARRLARRAARATTASRPTCPLDFVQNKVPKILADDLHAGRRGPTNPAQEWAPPGHGDLYTALVTSGMLDALLERGYRYAFVSNSDNLGAVLEPRTLALVRARGDPVPARRSPTAPRPTRRAATSRARRDGGGLVLREIAQTPDEDLDAFQDIARHRFFNTNNALARPARRCRTTLDARDGVLGLPMIVNRKTVDPARQGARPRSSSSRPRWARRSTSSTARGRCACRASASSRSRRRTTCSSCARTPTCSTTTPRLVLAPARDAAPLVDLDADALQARRRLRRALPGRAAVARRVRAADRRRRRDVRRAASSCAGERRASRAPTASTTARSLEG